MTKHFSFRKPAVIIKIFILCAVLSGFFACASTQGTDTAARLSDIEKEELAFNNDIKKRSSDADARYNSYKAEYGKKKAVEAKEFSDEEKSLTKKIAVSKGVTQFDLQADLNKLRKKKKEKDVERERDLQAEKKKYDEIKKKIAIEQQDKKPYLTAEKAALKANLQREQAEKKALAQKEAQIKQEAEKKQAQAERTLSADKAKKEKERIAQERNKRMQALAEEEKKYREKRKQEEIARRAKVEQQQKQIAKKRAAEAKAWKEAEARRIAKLEAEQKAINDKMRADDERRAAEDKKLRQKLAEIVTSQEDCGCDLKCMRGWSAPVDIKVTDKTSSSPYAQNCNRDKPAKHIEYTNTHKSAKLKVRFCFKVWNQSTNAYEWMPWGGDQVLKPGESAQADKCSVSDYRLYQKKEGEVAEKKEEKKEGKAKIIINLQDLVVTKSVNGKDVTYKSKKDIKYGILHKSLSYDEKNQLISMWVVKYHRKFDINEGYIPEVQSFYGESYISGQIAHVGYIGLMGTEQFTIIGYYRDSKTKAVSYYIKKCLTCNEEDIDYRTYLMLKKQYEDEGKIVKIIGK